MNELTIQTHNFEESKHQLKIFSEQTTTDLELRKVDSSGGLFGLFDHRVTGDELNNLTSQIQGYLIDMNTLHTEFIKEFGQVYTALEALDKDYIQAILIAIKAAEKANVDVKVAQEDIKRTIELQKKTINVLKQFKDKIDKYKHLEDIDKIWAQCKGVEVEIASLKETIAGQEDQIKNLRGYLEVEQEQSKERNQICSRNLKIAYVLAGSSLGITLLEFILFVLRIL